jgi:hypothetical protein
MEKLTELHRSFLKIELPKRVHIKYIKTVIMEKQTSSPSKTDFCPCGQ